MVADVVSCSICYNEETSIVEIDCGQPSTHTFCTDCITQHLNNASTCPMCRAYITDPCKDTIRSHGGGGASRLLRVHANLDYLTVHDLIATFSTTTNKETLSTASLSTLLEWHELLLEMIDAKHKSSAVLNAIVDEIAHEFVVRGFW